jgi:hypothetical protein
MSLYARSLMRKHSLGSYLPVTVWYYARNFSVTSKIEILAKYSLRFYNKVSIKKFSNKCTMLRARLRRGYCNSIS